jgi:L-methionine (R)-S-oxide reductase
MTRDSGIAARLENILEQDVDRQEKGQRIVDALRAAGSYRWVGIYDVDLERNVVANIAWSGPAAPTHPTFSTTKGLTSRAIATHRTVNVGDVGNDPDYLEALGTTRSEIIVPVLSEDDTRVIGTIDLESDRPNAFDSATQRMLEQCARMLRPFWSVPPPAAPSG